MKFQKTLKVDPTTADEMERICAEADADVKKDGIEFDEEVTFDNGNRVAVQVCGPGEPGSESCWTQGVLFDPHGNELGCTDCGESFLGEYHILHDDDEYVVNVEKETG